MWFVRAKGGEVICACGREHRASGKYHHMMKHVRNGEAQRTLRFTSPNGWRTRWLFTWRRKPKGVTR